MPIEDIEFYDERRDLSPDVLSLDLIRQLSHLVWCVLKFDARESTCVDEANHFLKPRIARRDGLAIADDNGRIECCLIELNDDAGFKLKARRRWFEFEADGGFRPAARLTFGTIGP